jgi:hypothetical protein
MSNVVVATRRRPLRLSCRWPMASTRISAAGARGRAAGWLARRTVRECDHYFERKERLCAPGPFPACDPDGPSRIFLNVALDTVRAGIRL